MAGNIVWWFRIEWFMIGELMDCIFLFTLGSYDIMIESLVYLAILLFSHQVFRFPRFSTVMK